MNAKTQSLIRSLALSVGGYFVGRGLVDKDTVEAGAALVPTLGAAVWGLVHNHQRDKERRKIKIVRKTPSLETQILGPK